MAEGGEDHGGEHRTQQAVCLFHGIFILQWHHSSISHSTYIFFHMRPGRWYEVRVAAVNAYGFRGYSEPSDPFPSTGSKCLVLVFQTTFTYSAVNSLDPKPPKSPNDSKIIGKQFDGRYMTLKLVWCPSKSNLPVEKYKITWSLYVNSAKASMITNSSYVKDVSGNRCVPCNALAIRTL